MKKRISAILAASILLVSTPAFAGSGSYGKMKQEKTQPQNIVQTAQSAGSFSTLISLLESTGLDKTLSAEGPFTVFAPTDEAFSKVPQETLQALQNDPEQLKNVLTYHVVSGKVAAKQVLGLSTATTVQGGKLAIDTSDGVKVDNAKVVKTDVMASNGIIHVIDTVLIPNS